MIVYYFGLPFDWSAFWLVIILGVVAYILEIGKMCGGNNPYYRERQ
jgi:hypothetical protein